MKRFGLILIFVLRYFLVHGQIFEVDTIQFSGDSHNRINLVILGDGYLEGELSKFELDARSFSEGLFLEEPYAGYKDYFNVFIIKVPSNESGANHPGTATDVSEPNHPVKRVDNYFGSTFDYYNIHRLLVPVNEMAITNVLAKNFPSYDQVLILVNSPYYGGSGGQYATASLHSLSIEVAIHELGHSFAWLSDEYYAGDFYASEAVNMTKETDPALVRWKNWFGQKEVGVYQHCCTGNSAEWYRPHENCKMRYLGSSFCPVCVEGTIERIHSLVSPIDAFTPNSNTLEAGASPLAFAIDLIKPEPNTLKVEWFLNGSFFAANVASVLVNADDLDENLNTLTAYIQDTTEFLKVDNHETDHSYTVSWTIENTVPGNSANLAALAISAGTLSPAFAAERESYTAFVDHTVASITVTGSVEKDGASITINEQDVDNGAVSPAISLQEGTNTIQVLVTAPDGISTKNYTIQVTRENSPAKMAAELSFPDQTITYSPASFDLGATSNSEGDISYSVVDDFSSDFQGKVTLSGMGNRTVTVKKSGQVKLRARVEEDEHYLADEVEMVLSIQKATATVLISGLSQEYNGGPRPVTVLTDPENLEVVLYYNGLPTVPSEVGEYEVNAEIVEDNYTGEANAHLNISIPTAISAPELTKDIRLYPNPTAGKAILEFKPGTKVGVTVMNLSGQIIKKATARGSYEVDLGDCAAGMYLVVIQPKDGAAVTFKLQKQ